MQLMMNQELARTVQRDYHKVAAQHRLVSPESAVGPAVDEMVVRHHWRATLSSNLARLRLIQLQWPIRFAEG